MANYNSDYTGAQIDSAVSRANSSDVTAGTVAASKAVVVDSNKDITGFRHIVASGTVTAANVSLTGNVDLGDASGDTVTITGSIDSNLIPATDDTYDLGSASNAWQDLFLEGDINFSDGAQIDVASGDFTLDVAGDIEFNADGGDFSFKDDSSTLATISSSGVVTGTMTITSASITDSSGSISFGNENLTTSGTIQYGSISDGSITITAFVDEDGMDSNSATLVPTQQSVKAYVDAQVTAQDLDFQGDSGGALNIDLDSETLTIAGGEGIDTSGSSNTITIAGEDATTSNKGIASFSSDNFSVSSGAVTIKDDGVILATETTGDYVQNITGGTGIDSTGATSGENIAHTLSVDLNELTTETSIADADFIAMVDATDDASGKITFENLEDAIFASVSGDIAIAEDGTATIQANSVAMATDTTGDFVNSITAGTGLTSTGATSGENISHSLSVDAAQTQITSVGTLNAGAISSGFGAIDIGSSNFTTTGTIDISGGTLTLADNQISGNKVEGGTIAAVTISALTTAGISASTDLDIGSHGFRASTLTADSQTSGRVAIYGTNGLLTEDSDLSFSGSTLSATNVNISGTLTTTGTVQEVSTTNLNVEDPLILLNKYDSQPSNNAFDAGIVIKRGSSDSTPANVAFIFDESANQFALIDTDEDGTTAGNVTITDYENLRIGALTADDASTFTSTISAATGSTIGNLTLANGSITDSSGAISFGNENLSTSGTLGAGAITGTSFVIGSANINEAELEIIDGGTITTSELNILDGDTSATSTTVADADRVVMNDNGTMVQVAVTDLSAYFDDEITAMPNLASVGTLTALQVDNININGNTIISSDTNGHINLTPNGSGEVNISKVDIDSGTIDGTTIATSDVTVGSGKTLDVSGGTLTLADDQIPMAKTAIVAGTGISLSTNTLNVDASQTQITSVGTLTGLTIENATNPLIVGDGTKKLFFDPDSSGVIVSTATSQGGEGHYYNDALGEVWTTIDGTAKVKVKASAFEVTPNATFAGDIDVDGTTNLDAVDIDGAVHIKNTGDTYITVEAGASDGNVGFLFDDSGSNQHGAILYDTDDLILLLDSDGVIRLDADGGQIQFLDGGTEIGVIENSSSNLVIESKVQDKDIVFKGNDGGSGITALTLDMSDGGNATFAGDVNVTADGARFFVSSADYELVSIGRAGSSGSALDQAYIRLKNAGTNTVAIHTAGDSYFNGGRVGIGDSSPGAPLDVKSGEAANTANFNSTSGATNITLESSGSLIGQMEFVSSGTSKIVTRTSASLALGSNNVRTLYITDDDRVGIGTASPTHTLDVQKADAVTASFNRTGSSGEVVLIQDDGSTVAELRTDQTYNYTSDYRLKENIEDLDVDALARVNALKPRIYNFKKSPTIKREGFIAHELQGVIAKAVQYEKDGVDEEGKPKYQMMNDGAIIPTLVKAIQELSAKVEALENA